MTPATSRPKQILSRLGSVARAARLARWSLRKLQLPIGATDLVLDVGSGASPHPRADVLLERYVSGQHRHGAVAVVDRPIVIADACRMPFKDKAFDYVIAFHILEHIPTPDLFLRELMRVAKAGYIETPNVMFERLVPYDVHCLEVMNVNGRLVMYKKSAPATDPFLTKLRVVPNAAHWNDFFYGNPEYFHVCYHWKDRIEFEIANPDEPCAWYMQGDGKAEEPEAQASTAGTGLRGLAVDGLRRFYANRRRLPVDVRGLLVCPNCRSQLEDEGSGLRCRKCDKLYANSPWPTFT